MQSHREFTHTDSAVSTDPKNLRVLVIDSKGSSRQNLCTLLRDCAYQVSAVKTAREALQLLTQDPEACFDLVLKEHEPPGVNACRLLRKLARIPELQRVPVVVISSQDERDIVMTCLTLGAIDYLVKPLRQNELRNIWTRVWFWRRGLHVQNPGLPQVPHPTGHSSHHGGWQNSYHDSSSDSKETKCDDEDEPTSKEGSAPDDNNGHGSNNGNGHGSNNGNGSNGGNGTSRVEAKAHGGKNGSSGDNHGSNDNKNGNGNSATKNGNGSSGNGNGASTTLFEKHPGTALVNTAEGKAPPQNGVDNSSSMPTLKSSQNGHSSGLRASAFAQYNPRKRPASDAPPTGGQDDNIPAIGQAGESQGRSKAPAHGRERPAATRGGVSGSNPSHHTASEDTKDTHLPGHVHVLGVATSVPMSSMQHRGPGALDFPAMVQHGNLSNYQAVHPANMPGSIGSWGGSMHPRPQSGGIPPPGLPGFPLYPPYGLPQSALSNPVAHQMHTAMWPATPGAPPSVPGLPGGPLPPAWMTDPKHHAPPLMGPEHAAAAAAAAVAAAAVQAGMHAHGVAQAAASGHMPSAPHDGTLPPHATAVFNPAHQLQMLSSMLIQQYGLQGLQPPHSGAPQPHQPRPHSAPGPWPPAQFPPPFHVPPPTLQSTQPQAGAATADSSQPPQGSCGHNPHATAHGSNTAHHSQQHGNNGHSNGHQGLASNGHTKGSSAMTTRAHGQGTSVPVAQQQETSLGTGGTGNGNGHSGNMNANGTTMPEPHRRRALALDKYRKKRNNLRFSKTIRYESRKQLAQQRPRFRGQFVSYHAGTAEEDGYDQDEEDQDEMLDEDDMEEDAGRAAEPAGDGRSNTNDHGLGAADGNEDDEFNVANSLLDMKAGMHSDKPVTSERVQQPKGEASVGSHSGRDSHDRREGRERGASRGSHSRSLGHPNQAEARHEHSRSHSHHSRGEQRADKHASHENAGHGKKGNNKNGSDSGSNSPDENNGNGNGSRKGHGHDHGYDHR